MATDSVRCRVDILVVDGKLEEAIRELQKRSGGVLRRASETAACRAEAQREATREALSTRPRKAGAADGLGIFASLESPGPR